MKFAGGWFTCISKKLLDKITVPDSLGHYGLEDTFIMWGSEKLRIGQQFKIKNLVVCENYRYRNNKHLSEFILSIDRREEFKQIALLKGFLIVASSPLTRSSYHADEDFLKMKKLREKQSQCHQLQ